MISKQLRQKINVYCHAKSQGYAQQLKAHLIQQARERLRSGQTIEQVHADLFKNCTFHLVELK